MNKPNLLIQIGAKIQSIRLKKGLSQVDLVGKIEGKIDTTNISRIERGRVNSSILTLQRIADALEVDIIDFFKP